jgi:hypothetical protein
MLVPRFIAPVLFYACLVGVAIPAPPANPPQDQPPPAASTTAPSPDSSEVRFSGEIVRGQAFTRDVGHNLTFRLTPAASDEGGGWVIEILPPVVPADDPVEFSSIATPPYHAYNDRYIAAAFGYSAREAAQATLRKFNFVESVDDEHVASEVVNALLYPSTIGEADRPRIAAESAALNLGTGQLRILHAHVATPKDGSPETIASLKFEVVLNFSPGLTLQQVLAPHPPDRKR